MRTFGGMVGLLLVLTACTGGGSDEPVVKKTPGTLTRDASTVKAAWTLDVEAVGQPVVAKDAGVAVVITKTSGKRLEIVGVDVRTGARRWAHPYSPNDLLPGVAISPAVTTSADGTERVVFALAPSKPGSKDDADLTTPLAIVDPATGKIVATSPRITTSSSIDSCEDDHDVCVRGYLPGGDFANYRLDLASGKLSKVTTGAPDGARLIGSDGLFSTNDRPGEKIGVRRDGTTLWSAPVAKLFGDGRASDGGWAFVHDETADRYTGYLGQAYDLTEARKADGAKPAPYDLAKQPLVSFDGKDGSVLWKKVGADTCFQPVGSDDEDSVKDAPHPVRCAVTGTLTYGDGDPELAGITMTIEGYDPVTGTTTWTHPMPDAAATAYWQQAPRVVQRSGDSIVAVLADGPTLIDTATGKTAPAKGTFVCETEDVEIDYVTPWVDGERKVNDRRGGGLLFPCASDGTASTDALSVAALQDGAVEVDASTYVLSSKDGLVGYTIGRR